MVFLKNNFLENQKSNSLLRQGTKMKKLLIVLVAGFQVLLAGCVSTGNWQHEDSVGTVEYYWYKRQILSSKEEAISTFRNLSPYYYHGRNPMTITNISVDNYGMLASGTWSEERSQYVPTWGGFFMGSTYIPTYGGYVQSSSTTRQGSFSISFKDVKIILLVRYPKIDAPYNWGVIIAYLDSTTAEALRVRSERDARQLVAAIETMAAGNGYDLGISGFSVNDLTQKQSSELGLPSGTGGYVLRVDKDGPFDKAGLRAGDIILSIDGKEQRGLTGLQNMWGGTKEWVILRRDSPMASFKKISLNINAHEVMAPMLRMNGYLSDAKSSPPASGKVSRGRIGVSIEEVSKGMAAAIGLPKAEGAVVNSVDKGGAADKAGLQAGDVILRFDGKPVSNAGEFAGMVGSAKPGSRANLQVWRKGSTRELSLVVDEAVD